MMTDTCHECCNVVTRLIEEANEERDILESKFKHYHKYKHVLMSIKRPKNLPRGKNWILELIPDYYTGYAGSENN